MTRTPSIRDDSKLVRLLIGIAVGSALAFAGAVCFYLFRFHGQLAHEQETWGQFGDYLGGVLNPLLGLAGLIALLYTIKLQAVAIDHSSTVIDLTMKALAHQIEEMKAAREEQEAQTKAQVAQFHASVHSLYVAAEQARIEQVKVEASALQPSKTMLRAKDIGDIATRIEGHAKRLSKRAP